MSSDSSQPDRKILFILAIVLVSASLLSYWVATAQYGSELDSKKREIERLEESLERLKSPVFITPVETTSPTSLERIREIVEGEEINCFICHELIFTKDFHVPQSIVKIADVTGKRRRICVDCHGPLGPPWSAEEQLTPLSDIVFNDRIGLNGVFEIPNKVPHIIHKAKMEEGVMRCQTCHGNGTDLLVPIPDLARGQVLVCQNCKDHPEGGNYIIIHVEMAGKSCSLCHSGGIENIHRNRTENLGQV